MYIYYEYIIMSLSLLHKGRRLCLIHPSPTMIVKLKNCEVEAYRNANIFQFAYLILYRK